MTSGRRGSYQGDERVHISRSTQHAVERIDQSILVQGWPGKRRASIAEPQEHAVSPAQFPRRMSSDRDLEDVRGEGTQYPPEPVHAISVDQKSERIVADLEQLSYSPGRA